MFLSDYRQQLPSLFYSDVNPTPVRDPRYLIKNTELAQELGMDSTIFEDHPGYFSGNEIPREAHPIAMAYSGHQFGHYVRLGDGRAVLLGEWRDPAGKLFDIQLKGAGPTPYSRGGDGRGAQGPMLREFLISEAMHALGIPTTRSLAVVATGEPVYRHEILAGAVLTRVAASHLRVGSFQYAMEVGGDEAVKSLVDYAIRRHDPELLGSDLKYQTWLRKVMRRQAKLVASWMGVGFIHGVMNTDNMSISGETIDYGPCAFMDYYDPVTVFSSIDLGGRYAYGRQPLIAQWNLARLAETLLGLLEKEEGLDLKAVEDIVGEFTDDYRRQIRQVMAAKLGIADGKESDERLLQELMQWMKENKADYTNTFYDLTSQDLSGEIYADEVFINWKKKWQERLRASGVDFEESIALMKKNNPVVIPRNHLVEEALKDFEMGNRETLDRFWKILKEPYAYDREIPEKYRFPLNFAESRTFQTFCGT